MEPKMIKFPSIEQSRHVLPNIIRDAQFTHMDEETNTPCYNTSAELPILEFRGTVKLHGANAAIVQNVQHVRRRGYHFQSRQRILSVESDLEGFYVYMSGQTNAVTHIFDSIFARINNLGHRPCKTLDALQAVAVFGEWCGTGIQKGVALSKIRKMFVIFGVSLIYKDDPPEWLDVAEMPQIKDEKARIFNIMQFQTFHIVIDFNKDESLIEAKEKMDELTLAVEAECPVGKHFGESGTGEGIVWTAIKSPTLPDFKSGRYTEPPFWFKTKGVKHASYRRPKKNPKGQISLESQTKMDAFVELVITPGRLEQGLQVLEREMLLPIEMKSVGAFIKWVHEDVIKEEYDRVEEAQVDRKALSGLMAAVAKKWYMEQLEDPKRWTTG